MPGIDDRASASPPSLRDAKQRMRVHILALRDALDSRLRVDASRRIGEAIDAMPEIRGAGSLLVTLPFRSEWDTLPLVRCALERGQAVVVPRANPAARMLDLCGIRDLAEDIVVGHLGIPEPRPGRPTVAPAAIDAIVVPGVAFDAFGGRLGYGGGYFDRLFPLVGRDVPRIAGAFDVQVVERVPAGPHDVRVDAIVTPTRTLRIAR